jgi:polyhydroxyalkanoate synthesis repressor PhaR
MLRRNNLWIIERVDAFATLLEVVETLLFTAQKDPVCMRQFKKYPNRRLYDIEESKYVTVEDIRKIILKGESITVVDSKTEKELTRTVLMQIISEQEAEGHEPILTNRVLEQLIRFYGDSMQSVFGKYIEQSITTFLDQQERYRRNMRDLSNVDPVGLMRSAMEQNLEFWSRLTKPPGGSNRE